MYDVVVVMPTGEYERKPYLRNSFARRLELARQVIAARPELAGRVAVSDAMGMLPSSPAELVRSLLERYPTARFA